VGGEEKKGDDGMWRENIREEKKTGEEGREEMRKRKVERQVKRRGKDRLMEKRGGKWK